MQLFRSQRYSSVDQDSGVAVAATQPEQQSQRFGVLVALLAVAALAASLLTACGSDSDSAKGSDLPEEPIAVSSDVSASTELLESASSAVVSSPDDENQRRAAAVAIAAQAPMFVVKKGEKAQQDVEAELKRLGVKNVFTSGEVALADADGRTVVKDPGTIDGLKKIVDVEFAEAKNSAKGSVEAAREVAEMDPEKPTVPKGSGKSAGEGKAEGSFPRSEAKANDDAIAFADPKSPLGAIATARAAGLPVKWLPIGDARATKDSIQAARDGKKLVGLGEGFGDAKKFAKSVELARDESIEQLPGGGTLLFPGRHMVATYGHPGVAPLGVMGEEDPEGAVKTAQEYVDKYQNLTDDKVIPAFEIIASVAQGAPGPRGDFTEPAPVEVLEPYVDAMTEAGGYVIIDLQPGSADFVEQAKLYEPLLKRPNVGLALDSEWKMQPGELPGSRVGNVEIEEVNRVVDWLADLTEKNNLPQKMLMLHQFQLQMIRDREKLDLSRPELSVVLHADGHGTPQEKFETWDVLRQDLQPEIFMAWKNFIDEDMPMFTPEQTMDIEPRPWVVTYQ
ncbi:MULTISPECIES: hypothetical protein [unclassified Corynebacterium]|uniref:hypothetical protein n=1 Tax=unclassified Corynebacterium TaxID=2624378 RepID=UPI00309A6C6C